MASGPLSDESIIVSPDRLALVEQRILSGEPIDAAFNHRLATLQAIDVVNVGAEYAEQAARRQREADERIFTE